MTDEHDLAVPRRLERGGDRPNDIVHVNEGVGGVPAADERQQAQPGALEQRQQRAVARTIDHARPQDRPAQSRHRRHEPLAVELAAAVRRPRTRRIVLGARRGGRGGTRGREARDVHEMRTGGGGGADDGAGAFDVDGGVDRLVERVDDAGEMDDGVDAGKCLAQGARLERRSNDRRAAGHLVRRLGPDDGADIDPALDEVRGHVPADETGRAGHGHRQCRISVVIWSSVIRSSIWSLIFSAIAPTDDRLTRWSMIAAPSRSRQRFLIDAIGLVLSRAEPLDRLD